MGGVGRAWFPIDMLQLQLAMNSGNPRYLVDKMPSGLLEASSKVSQFLEATGIDLSRAAVGGFSQGAMVASHAVMSCKTLPALLIQMSGTVAGHGLIADDKRSKLAVFQSHGKSDPILAYSSALALKEWFVKGGTDHSWIDFPGGHEIPNNVIMALKNQILLKTAAKNQGWTR